MAMKQFCLIFLNPLLLMNVVTKGTEVNTDIPRDGVPTCPAPPPCSCDQDNILCNDRKLSRVPKFNKHHVKYHWQLNLSNNNITQIPSRAFENLHIYSLLMWNTGLTTVAEDAFAGSEFTLISMTIKNNNLSELPLAIGKLRNITTLRINNNPITVFSESVFMAISSTLNFLDFGSEAMTTWPSSIRFLKSLFALNVYNLPVSDLPLDAFAGLENCLTLLDFQSTMLENVPTGINRLRALQGLTFTDNSKLTSTSFSKDIFANMSNFKDITVINSSLSSMPDFSEIRNLHSILMLNCGLEEWKDGALADPTPLSYIALNATRFSTFPSVLSRATNLQVLSLSYSQFHEIPSKAFQKLQKLTRLELYSTPISNISFDAFKGNPDLQDVRLDTTSMTEIPTALANLSSLHYINMWNDALDCTCESMGWIKHWINFSSVQVTGKCENLNGTDVEWFTKHFVPMCPDV